MHSFEIHVESRMLRQAWHAWYFDRLRTWRLAIAGLMICSGFALDLWSGHLGTLSIVSLTILGLAVLLYISAYVAGLRRALAKREAIMDGKVGYELSDDTIKATSSLGSIALAWPAVAELRRYEDLILIGFRGAAYSTIPAAQIPPAALAFLAERARAAGAQMRGI